MSQTPQSVIVLGAGIVGSSCAWYLRHAGMAVTLLDPVAPGQATSFGNAGCISPSGIVPFSYPGVMRQVPGWLTDPLGPLRIRWSQLPRLAPWLWRFWRSGNWEGVDHMARSQRRLMDEVTDDWTNLLASIGAPHLRESRGCLMVYDSRDEYQRDHWMFTLKDRFGYKWQELSKREVYELEPAITLGKGVGILLPDWQHIVDPGKATRTIAEAAVAAGTLWLQDGARSVRPRSDGVRVTTSSGREFTADALVIAAGVWSNELIRQFDRAVPLAPKRGYHSMLESPSVDLSMPVQSASRLFMMTPMADGLRLAGTAEFAAIDDPPDYRRARMLVEHARHYLPQLEFSGTSEWMGQRPMLPDSLPVIGRSPRHGNVVYAFGHGHWGLTQGPTTGRLVADLVAGRPVQGLAPFSPDRF